VLAALMGLLWIPTTLAHRLDEYLQAMTLALEPDQLTLQLRLIPGVAVATKVLASIDTNGDGLITDAEQQRYIAWVRHDLSLTLNGKPLTLQVVDSLFPQVGEVSRGMGGILLTFKGIIPTGSASYRLTLENHHQSTISVYLVNCLVPENPAIHILGQSRNYNQSVYELTFAVGKAAQLQPSTVIPVNPPIEQSWTDGESVVKTYFAAGIHHILAGYDHLLFISALVLAAVSLWELVKIVSVFTLAHSLTLTLAALNLVYLPQQIVEPLIAISIIVVALQNILWPSYTHRRTRLAVIFFFGLFHGLGFAGGLTTVMHQLPTSIVLWGIIGFSLGVELGHQLILLPLFGLLKAVRYSRRDALMPEQLFRSIQRLCSAAIAIAGLYYLWIAFRAQT
jgi:hydrogenase/urease accessory protein HupE